MRQDFEIDDEPAQAEPVPDPAAGMRTLEDPTAIIATDDIRFEYVACPEWNGRVRVRGLTSKEKAALEKKMTEERRDRRGQVLSREVNTQLFREYLIIAGCVREDGKPLFGIEHKHALREKSGAPTQRVADAISRLSGYGQNDVEALTAELRESPSSASSTA